MLLVWLEKFILLTQRKPKIGLIIILRVNNYRNKEGFIPKHAISVLLGEGIVSKSSNRCSFRFNQSFQVFNLDKVAVDFGWV